MDILIRYGFSIEEIKDMMDTNEEIESISDNRILELISILTSLGCHEEHIMNIFCCNPFCLSRDITSINMLISKLKEKGFCNINILLDTNPYLLNLNDVDIDSIFLRKEKDGLTIEEIIDYFNNNIILEG